MGPKALLPYRGRPLLESVAGALLDGGCREVIVVLGAGAATVRAKANLERFQTVFNPVWQSGMGSSYLLGSSEADPSDHLLIALVDRPGLTSETVVRLLAAHRQGRITAAAYREGLSGEIRRGHPLMIDVSLRRPVSRTVTGDAGARLFLRTHSELVDEVECSDQSRGEDIDTPEQLHLLQ
jgi:nicotine blue oxidoreductase